MPSAGAARREGRSDGRGGAETGRCLHYRRVADVVIAVGRDAAISRRGWAINRLVVVCSRSFMYKEER
ncbi:hypothetical protein BDY21DRAFT_349012 [Lineolata rhizophorae]|uniref:Uncharacterized protein n=1 Tax=Lineolata rhizophorae TaxID=578093 RepID=A0A6A6NVV1_9PEZI|nr:hypothetical protein BDY21DRAFT_349012 [Lineolata rhizophorae]